MRKLLLPIVACCATLFTLAQTAQAAPNYQGLPPGTKFKLTVTHVVSTKASLTKTGKAPIPSGIPKYAKNSKVQFTIGSKGELKGPGFSIPFKSASVTDNVYSEKVKKSNPKLPNTAVVRKNTTTKKAEFAEASFFKITGSGMSTATHTVTYIFEK